jgi:hypothetical protein
MKPALTSVEIIQAFEALSIKLKLRREFDQKSAVVPTMHAMEFSIHGQPRELTVYQSDSRITFFVEDDKRLHRAMYAFNILAPFSWSVLAEEIQKNGEFIASLLGASVVDKPLDWRGYK